MTTLLTQQQYTETAVVIDTDPLLLMAQLADEADGRPHMVYENGTSWSYAEGVFAEIIVDASHVRFRSEGIDRDIEWNERPLDIVTNLLSDIKIDDWRAYGTAEFELAYANYGLEVDLVPSSLLHIVVPRSEVRIHGKQIVVRAMDDDDAKRLDAIIQRPTPERQYERLAVETDNLSAAEYRESVSTAIRAIQNDELQKVILSRIAPVVGDVDLVGTYVLGRRANTPARSFLVRIGETHAVGFSPETVVEVDSNRRVRTQPLAGTRALSPDIETSARLREVLLTDSKEVFEHAISVKLAFDELLEICNPESINIVEYMGIKERGSVQHLGSTVEGNLAEGVTALDAIAVLFPAVTASGIPKRAAFECIRRIETARRGLYAGAALTIDQSGELDAALILRTLYQSGGLTWLQAGAGIVGESVPERELEETREKMRSIGNHVARRRS